MEMRRNNLQTRNQEQIIHKFTELSYTQKDVIMVSFHTFTSVFFGHVNTLVLTH